MKYRSNHTGQLIKKARRALAMPQMAVSKILSTNSRNAQFVSNIERGKCGLPAKHAAGIASKLSISLDTLKNAMVMDYAESLDKELDIMRGDL